MSSKGEQIIARLFVKVALLISDARENQSARAGTGGRADKWFQLEVMDDGRFGGFTQELKELGTGPKSTLEMRVRSVLVLGPPSPAQALVLVSDSKRTRIDIPPDARAILLEEWSLSLDRTTKLDQTQGDDPYPGVYKQAIALIRSLYALLRYVPAWQLHRKLGPGSGIKVVVVATLVGKEEDADDEDVLGLTHQLVPDELDPITFAFPPIVTPLGAISLRTRYRPNVRFRLDPLESLWSSAFANPTSPGGAPSGATPVGRGSVSPASPSPPAPKLDLDSPAFTPTLLATRQRASLSGSGSPLRPASRMGTSPGTAASPVRPRTISQLSAGGETAPRSPPQATDLFGGASGLTRTRRESLLTRGSVSGSVTPLGLGVTAPPSPRRTSNTINPFKGATLASSPRALGMASSPLGSGSPRTTPGLGLGTSPRTGIGLVTGPGAGTSPLSGTGAGSDGRRSLESGENGGLNTQPQPIKRYSSSFGHRPGRSEGSLGSGGIPGGAPGSVGTTSAGTGGGGVVGSLGAGSTGTGGSGGLGAAGTGPQSRLSTIGSQSYLSHMADDDDIGRFLEEIDTRPQLGLAGNSPLGIDTNTATEQFPLSSPQDPFQPPDRFPLQTERFPSVSPQAERFSPSSLPARYSGLPQLSPLARTYDQSPLRPFELRASPRQEVESPRGLPLPLDSVPPSPAEGPWATRERGRFGSRATSRERTGERKISLDNRYGVRGPSTSRERQPMSPLAPLPERPLGLGLEERTRTMSLGPSTRESHGALLSADRTSPFMHERARTTSLTPSHERERTISFASRNRKLLTSRDEVEAAVQLMKASFQASYAPAGASSREAAQGLASPALRDPSLRVGSSPKEREVTEGSSVSVPRARRMGSEEVVGRLELSGSSGFGMGAKGSVRPGRDTDGWKEGGEWDQRMSGWR